MSRIIEFRKSAQKAEKQSVQGKTCAFTGHRPQSLPFGFDAVSYTHLDVYKRQPSMCAVCWMSLRTSVKSRSLISSSPPSEAGKSRRQSSCSPSPVSYTHLLICIVSIFISNASVGIALLIGSLLTIIEMAIIFTNIMWVEKTNISKLSLIHI